MFKVFLLQNLAWFYDRLSFTVVKRETKEYSHETRERFRNERRKKF